MPENVSAPTSGMTSDEMVRDVLRRFIQRSFDRRAFTRASLAAESGVSLCQIDQIVSRDRAKQRRVAAEDALNLAYTLGADAVAALVGTIAYTAAHRDSRATETARIVADILPDVATIAAAVADGRIDHVERPGTTSAADHIIATILPLSSAGDRA